MHLHPVFFRVALYCVLQYNATLEDTIMPSSRSTRSPKKPGPPSTLMVRLDRTSKKLLTQAARLRRVSLSDYVREVTVAQAGREVRAANEQVISLTPDEQLAFWTALSEPTRLTDAQKRLGAIMRGDS
jgi:uncharacterized protein (DUF1778 family)